MVKRRRSCCVVATWFLTLPCVLVSAYSVGPRSRRSHSIPTVGSSTQRLPPPLEFTSSSSSPATSITTTTTARNARSILRSDSHGDLSLECTNAVVVTTTTTTTNDHPKNDPAGLPSSASSFPQVRMMESVGPVVSAALLITANTVGAGCLVLPELAVEPGLGPTTLLFVAAYILNVISGGLWADVAITTHQRRTLSSSSPPPTSLNDFATLNFESSWAGYGVAVISLFVNSCVMAFDLNRFGSVLGSSHGGVWEAPAISITMAALVVTAMTTLSSRQLSLACSVCVMVLFASFGALLGPGLLAVPTNDVASVFTTPGTAPDVWSAAVSIFPIILMSGIFQNIIPVVVQQLQYDRTKSMTAIVVGSMIPLIMYVAWCYTCLGGGMVDPSMVDGGGGMLTIFSMATLVGSSLCTGMSLAEEFHTILVVKPSDEEDDSIPPNVYNNNQQRVDHDVATTMTTDTTFSLPTVLPSVGIPLLAALVGGNDGLTGALAMAGSLGSPLLYGFLPALMAWRQRQPMSLLSSSSSEPSLPPQPYMIPSLTLPALGVLSTVFVGQDMLSRFNDLMTFAS